MAQSVSAPLFETRRIFLDVAGSTLEEVVGDLAARLEAAGDVPNGGELARRLLERERLGCTGLGNGLAIPHCKLEGLEHVLLAIGIARTAVDFHSVDGRPVRLLFLVLSPAESPAGHLQALARISRLVKSPGVTDAILSAGKPEEVASALRDAEARLAPA
jgi:PTS system nitrogen regulatory IIA component